MPPYVRRTFSETEMWEFYDKLCATYQAVQVVLNFLEKVTCPLYGWQ